MNERENLIEAIKFGAPEYVPWRIPTHGIGYFGCDHEGYDNQSGHDVPIGTQWRDVWGTGWVKEHGGVMGFPREFPLDKIEKLHNYTFPDPNDPAIYARIFELAQGYSDDCFMSGSHRDTLWEKSYMLCGMENMMDWFFSEPNHARDILKRIMDFQIGIAQHYIKAGVEMVGLSDDLGTQRSLILSPRIIREFLMPEYARLCNFYKSHGVLINFHSCGHILPVVDMFIELGVDILNPVQATANNLPALRERTDGRLALCGGVSTSVIMTGDTYKIRAEVRRAMVTLGARGGYICAVDQYMPFPPGALDAVYACVEQHGRYPLD